MFQFCFAESTVYTEINTMYTSRDTEMFAKLKVVILTSIVLLFSTQVGVKAESMAYYGVN